MLSYTYGKKFDFFCPHCCTKVEDSIIPWNGIWDDLNEFGKAVFQCQRCGKLFIIREEDDDGPFVCK